MARVKRERAEMRGNGSREDYPKGTAWFTECGVGEIKRAIDEGFRSEGV